MLDVGDEHAVALAELAGLGVEEELRHEEQRQTLGARAGALGAGQHQVDDVLEQVVGVARGDEALHAVDVPGAVVLLDGLGAAGADVGAGVGLGQHHGGAPAALGGQHGPLLLLFGAEVVEDVGEAGAHRVHVDRGVGAEDVLVQRPRQRAGHRHAAEFLGEADACPSRRRCTARTDFLNGSGSVTEWVLGSKTGGLRSPSANDSAIGPSASRAISPSISRDGVGVEVGVLALTERLVDAEHLEQVEYLVTDVALVVAHDVLLDENATCGWVLGSKLPTSNCAQLYRSVTSTQSNCEQFPCR